MKKIFKQNTNAKKHARLQRNSLGVIVKQTSRITKTMDFDY